MTKLGKRLILAGLISLEALICVLILISLAATQMGGSSAQLFYWADTHAQSENALSQADCESGQFAAHALDARSGRL